MKKIIDTIKEMFKDMADRYIDAMNNFGEAINNSRGLVGA